MTDVDATPLWVPLAAAVIRRLPRGRYVAMSWLGERSRPFVARMPAEVGGLRFACYVHDWKMREVCFAGRYEPLETALVTAVVRPGSTFLDVGANWGYFTLIAAARVGREGRVLSVECDPRQLGILRGNLLLNDLPHVEVAAIAAASETGTLKLQGYDESDANWGLSKVVTGGGPGASGATTFDVPARALDDLLDERRIDKVGFLKMDIEGAEEFAVKGMTRGLARGRYERVLLELHPEILAERGTTVASVLEPFHSAGYRAFWLDHSQATSRRAAYARSLLPPKSFLQRRSPGDALDDWPHAFLLAPGIEEPEVTP